MIARAKRYIDAIVLAQNEDGWIFPCKEKERAHMTPFWRGAVLKHKQMVFTSFGDPYKIHDFPYLKTYVNAFSYSEATQRAFVKAILGEITFQGNSPVELPK